MFRIGCAFDASDFHLPHCLRHPTSAKSILANSPWTTGSLRPMVGILLSVAAALVGWLYSPTAALLIFRMMLGYDAWTSRSIHCGEGTPRIFRN